MLPTRLRAALSASLVAVLAATVLSGCGNTPAVSTVGELAFERPLAIPPLAPSAVDPDGTRVFELDARAGESEFMPGVRTGTWGFGQAYLGPTLRAARGERVRVRVTNGLDEPTSVHWHGMHLPAVMDGGPHQPVEPGALWEPEWEIDQPAATLWYHPHPHGQTERHVRMGLAGMFLLDDPVEAALPLPRDYGVDDVPVIVQDVAFDRDGALAQRDGGFSGALGDQLLVNGTLGPYLEVGSELVRLRLLNASTARVYAFALSDGREFQQIATDGGLLTAPVTLGRVQLSPGERAEIVVRMEPGETVVLRSEAPDLGGVLPMFGLGNGGGDRFDVLELRAAARLSGGTSVPEQLAAVEQLGIDGAVQRSFRLDGTQINGREMDMSRIDLVAELGTTELWTIENGMASAHNFHVHDVQFQILRWRGGPPPPELAGWKDTVYLRPNEEVVVVMRFEDYADPEHPYMYHCHLLRHEDQGMMGQFLVVAPGQAPVQTGEQSNDHHH